MAEEKLDPHPRSHREAHRLPDRAAYVDKGYRGHNASNPHRVFISGQKRGVFGVIERELRRRSAIEPVIGHMKTDGHLGRCHLKGREGDAANVVLTAIGHNLRLVLAWLRLLWPRPCRALALAPIGLLTDDYAHQRGRAAAAAAAWIKMAIAVLQEHCRRRPLHLRMRASGGG
jgi:IS5 family transposase